METELKFKLTAARRKRIEQILAERGLSPAKTAQRLETTYFDTPDFAIAEAGWSLRIRRTGKDFFQALKSAGGNVHRRETEGRVTDAQLDTSRLIATPLSRIPELEDRLSPLFITDIGRTTYRIPLGGEATAELAIDQGTIRAGRKRQAVHELEIELKHGAPAALYRFAVELHVQQPLEITVESKAARGYRLIRKQPPAAHKSNPPALPESVTVPAAFARRGGQPGRPAIAAFAD